MPVKDYNTDPDLNTTISGINIAEGCAPSGINNAIRQLMADVKEEFEGEDGAVSALRALIAEEVAQKLDVSGGTMTNSLAIQYPQFTSGTLPSSPIYRSINFVDKNGTVVNRILSFVNATGLAGISIGTNNYKGDGELKAIAASVDADGVAHFTAGGNDVLVENALVMQTNKGYMRLTNGLLLHWGYVTSTTQVVSINFSPAFSGVHSYVCIPFSAIVGDAANYNPNVIRSSASRAAFNSMIGKAANAFYIAIGY